jgi:hypothetical protein
MKPGSILIKEGALLPQALQIERDPLVPGWRLVKNFDGRGLDRAVRQASWTFFCLAGGIEATVLGFDTEKMARRAVARILVNPQAREFNSLEITKMVTKRFLGVRYLSVFAQSRHIQESLFLFSPERIKESGRAKSSAIQTRGRGIEPPQEFASESTNGRAAVAARPSM